MSYAEEYGSVDLSSLDSKGRITKGPFTGMTFEQAKLQMQRRQKVDVDVVEPEEEDAAPAAKERKAAVREDPFRGVRGVRGRKKYYYTYEDIAAAVSISEVAVKQYVYRKSFDPNNFASTVNFIIRMLRAR